MTFALAPLDLVPAVWLFAFGGAVGSFLNVVAYRLPAGKSVLYPPSFCPRCLHPIRWRDNVPIFGWVLLRGRCRDCGEPIALRYPLVEALLATVFLVVGMAEGFSGGANLPLRPWPVAGDVPEVIFRPLLLEESLAVAGYHLLLLSTLWAIALIEHDRHSPPARVAWPGLIAGFVLPLFWPLLRPVPAAVVQPDWLGGLIDGLAGLGLGMLVGLAVWRWPQGRARSGVVLAPMLVGLFLGWQAAAVLAPLTAVFYVLAALLDREGRARSLPAALSTLATIAYLLAWRRLPYP